MSADWHVNRMRRTVAAGATIRAPAYHSLCGVVVKPYVVCAHRHPMRAHAAIFYYDAAAQSSVSANSAIAQHAHAPQQAGHVGVPHLPRQCVAPPPRCAVRYSRTRSRTAWVSERDIIGPEIAI